MNIVVKLLLLLLLQPTAGKLSIVPGLSYTQYKAKHQTVTFRSSSDYTKVSRSSVIYTGAGDRRASDADCHGRLRTPRRRPVHPVDVRPSTAAKVRQSGEKRTPEAVNASSSSSRNWRPTRRRFVILLIDQR